MLGLAKLAPGPGNVDLVERPEREPGPGEVAVAVERAGICGTDLHIEAGEYACEPPVTIGHEVCGVVAETGPGVDRGLAGARVVCETYHSTCGVCGHCREGRVNLCRLRRSIGTHVDGAFAPRLLIPATALHRVPDGLDSATATLSEPLACVCQSVLGSSRIDPGDRVVVIGPGAIGLIAAQVARARGGRVAIRGTERDAARLAIAAGLGLALEPAGAGAEAEPADVVVECSGSERGVADALESLRPGGRLIQIGLRGEPITVPWDLICFNELRVAAGFASTPRSWDAAMPLIASGELALDPLISEVAPLGDWRRLFDATRAAEGVKFVLDPSA